MPGELLLINPRRRRKAKRATNPRRRRVAAKTTHHVRRRRRNPIATVAAAPRRRRRLSAVRHHNPRRRHSKRRSNPIGLSMKSIGAMSKDAAIGAVGAIAVDVAFGYAKSFLPVSMQTPADAAGAMNPMYFLAKGGMAVLFGVLGRKLTKQAGHMAEGSLTVTMYSAMQSFLPGSLTMGYYSPGAPASLHGHGSRSRMPSQLRGDGMAAYTGLNAYTGTSARAESVAGEYPYR